MDMTNGKVRLVSRPVALADLFDLVEGSASPAETGAAADAFELAKGAEAGQAEGAPDEQMISAADYDPSLDRREDERRRVGGVVAGAVGATEAEVVEEVEEVEEDDEDDVDDMFAIGGGEKKKKTVRRVKVRSHLFRPSVLS